MDIFSYSSRPRPSVDDHASGAMPYTVRRRARHARSAGATAHENEYQYALRACSRIAKSDGIQESTFRGMRAVVGQNKPVLFVLNVKRNIEHGAYKRRLLQDPNRVLGDNAVHGHINRIRQLACDELGMRKVDILVIHAQAAFFATMETNSEAARQLHEASGIDRLLCALTDAVRQRGPIRRLQWCSCECRWRRGIDQRAKFLESGRVDCCRRRPGVHRAIVAVTFEPSPEKEGITTVKNIN